MKKLFASALLLISATSFAETCTVVMRDYYGTQVNTFTRYSYSYDAACNEAQYDCKQDMAERQVNGGWYGLTCLEISSPNYPTPYPPSYPNPYPPSYPTPYPPSYPNPYPGPSYPPPLPPREPHWPSEPPPRYPDPGRDGHGDGRGGDHGGGWGHDGDRGGPGRR